MIVREPRQTLLRHRDNGFVHFCVVPETDRSA